MKIIIFACLFAIAGAKQFSVSDGNKTCALLDLEGTVDVRAFNESQPAGAVSLNFADATLIGDSNCTLFKLNLTESVQVWFGLASSTPAAQQVQPTAAFVPSDLFPATNDTELLVFTSDQFGSFAANQSYVCKSSVERPFSTKTQTSLNFTLVAVTENLKIQFGDIVNDTFSSDTSECDADKTTTPQPTTTPTPAVSSTPILPPEHEKVSVNVTNGNVTCILMEGSFTVAVTFEDTEGGKEVNVTRYLNVPQDAVASGNCSLNATQQIIEISFEKDWMLSFVFSKSASSNADSISISEIDITYDTAVFKASKPETKTVRVPKQDFLQSTTDGYYLCNANSTCADSENVKLTTTDLKYKAFSDKSDPSFDGNVAECPADEETSSVVPIAVGAALAGLVVIVLIAYLIGRRRSRKSGYESV